LSQLHKLLQVSLREAAAVVQRQTADVIHVQNAFGWSQNFVEKCPAAAHGAAVTSVIFCDCRNLENSKHRSDKSDVFLLNRRSD